MCLFTAVCTSPDICTSWGCADTPVARARTQIPFDNKSVQENPTKKEKNQQKIRVDQRSEYTSDKRIEGRRTLGKRERAW